MCLCQTSPKILVSMRPYCRTKKPVRHMCDEKFSPVLRKASKACSSIWLDIRNIWWREPTLPSFIRIVATSLLLWMLIFPLLYVFVPPFLTYVAYLILREEDFVSWLHLPEIPQEGKNVYYQYYKSIVKSITFRVSMVVTLYDYIQTFRVIGFFNHLR